MGMRPSDASHVKHDTLRDFSDFCELGKQFFIIHFVNLLKPVMAYFSNGFLNYSTFCPVGLIGLRSDVGRFSLSSDPRCRPKMR
jgi:hypothetical protein